MGRGLVAGLEDLEAEGEGDAVDEGVEHQRQPVGLVGQAKSNQLLQAPLHKSRRRTAAACNKQTYGALIPGQDHDTTSHPHYSYTGSDVLPQPATTQISMRHSLRLRKMQSGCASVSAVEPQRT